MAGFDDVVVVAVVAVDAVSSAAVGNVGDGCGDGDCLVSSARSMISLSASVGAEGARPTLMAVHREAERRKSVTLRASVAGSIVDGVAAVNGGLVGVLGTWCTVVACPLSCVCRS